MAVGVPPVVEELPDDALAARLSRYRFSRFGRRLAERVGRDIRGDRVNALAGAQADAPERADELRVFRLARPVAANEKSGQARLTPSLLAEALGSRHRHLRPAARAGNLDEAVHDLRVLAWRREPAPLIFERRRTVREEKPVPILYEPIAHGLRNCPGIGIRS